MSGKKKKRTLKREITLLTMATSFGALVLFGTVMIVMFFVFFLGNIREDMENILQNTLQNYQAKMPGRSCNDPSQFYTAGFF